MLDNTEIKLDTSPESIPNTSSGGEQNTLLQRPTDASLGAVAIKRSSRNNRPPSGNLNSDSSIGIYLSQIRKFDLLSAEEEIELAKEIEIGRNVQNELEGSSRRPNKKQALQIARATEAKTGFINANLRLVVSNAKLFPKKHGIELLDLIQQGNLGLEHAVDKFDWRKGFRFTTYATSWIRQQIRRYSDANSTIRLPADKSAELRRTLASLDGDTSKLNTKESVLYNLITPTSLDKPLEYENSSNLSDLIPCTNRDNNPEGLLLQAEIKDTIMILLDKLDNATKFTIMHYYGIDGCEVKTFAQIGEILGISRDAAQLKAAKGRKKLAEIAMPDDRISSLL